MTGAGTVVGGLKIAGFYLRRKQIFFLLQNVRTSSILFVMGTPSPWIERPVSDADQFRVKYEWSSTSTPFICLHSKQKKIVSASFNQPVVTKFGCCYLRTSRCTWLNKERFYWNFPWHEWWLWLGRTRIGKSPPLPWHHALILFRYICVHSNPSMIIILHSKCTCVR